MRDNPRLAAWLATAAFGLIAMVAAANLAPGAASTVLGTGMARQSEHAQLTATPAEVPWGAISSRLQMGN
jgi:hypothetical protein